MAVLEETSAKVDILMEEYSKRGSEVLIDTLGDMLVGVKRGKSFRLWYAPN